MGREREHGLHLAAACTEPSAAWSRSLPLAAVPQRLGCARACMRARRGRELAGSPAGARSQRRLASDHRPWLVGSHHSLDTFRDRIELSLVLPLSRRVVRSGRLRLCCFCCCGVAETVPGSVPVSKGRRAARIRQRRRHAQVQAHCTLNPLPPSHRPQPRLPWRSPSQELRLVGRRRPSLHLTSAIPSPRRPSPLESSALPTSIPHRTAPHRARIASATLLSFGKPGARTCHSIRAPVIAADIPSPPVLIIRDGGL